MDLFKSKKDNQSVPQEQTYGASSTRSVILHQGQSPGDILTFTNTVADLKESYPNWLIDVRSPCPEIWENNPRLTPLKDDEGEHFTIGYDEINECGWRQEHWTDAFRHDAEKKLGVPIKKTKISPELWISDLEKSWFNQVHCDLGWDGPYWILNAGHKDDSEMKQYHRWQEVVDILNKFFKGKVKIVQIGHQDHHHPKLTGTLSLIGRTDLRQLIRLGFNAAGSIGPLSFQSVMSAAFKQPGVVVCGSREDARWHLYAHMRYIYNNGCVKAYSPPDNHWGGAWEGGRMENCRDLVNGVPRDMAIIEPYMISDAVKMYYKGGLLTL
jgi:ADP-heptose:LPS heptosyltransferase